MPKRVLEGVVVSAKQDKTAVVRVERTYTRPLTRRSCAARRSYHAHDEGNVAM